MKLIRPSSQSFNGLTHIVNTFSTREKCIAYLEMLIWSDGIVVSPFDKGSKVYKCANGRYRCKNTKKYFNVLTNTIFEGSKVSLQNWFLAIYFDNCHKKGISSHQLAEDIQVCQKTAWFMLQRIRNAYELEPNADQFSGVVSSDEAYIGGRARNKHRNKRPKYIKQQGCRDHVDKIPLLGLMERSGRVRVFVVKNTKAETIHPLINKHVTKGATLIADDNYMYNRLKKRYDLKRIDHSKGNYATEDGYSTNNLEGFWSLLKRSILGIYHVVSKKHLQKYVDEAAFRYNTRNLTTEERFGVFLQRIPGKRLRYKDLISEQ